MELKKSAMAEEKIVAILGGGGELLILEGSDPGTVISIR